MHRTRPLMSAVVVLVVISGTYTAHGQWVMVARAAKNRVERMTQKSETGGYDVATVILEAPADHVYEKALSTIQAHPEITITQNDRKHGKIQFRKDQEVAGLQISAMGGSLTQLVIASSVGNTTQPSPTPLVVDAVMRICKEVKVECKVATE